jgi:hypothetical protein
VLDLIEFPTLFILGAGASKPYGYPTGIELRHKIIKDFSTELNELLERSTFTSSQRRKFNNLSEKFIENFSKSPIQSIDKYLSINPNFSYIGKIAITLSILGTEKKSKFLESLEPPYNAQDWYRLIFERMMDKLDKPDDFKRFKENKVAFITFNYDRSLEYFLYCGFHHTFCQMSDYISLSMENYTPFPIFHVYGQVAKTVNWDRSDYGEEQFYFDKIEKLSKGIRVIGERSSEQVKNEISKLFPEYKRIFFLGFGYADENLNAIDLPMSIDETWDVFGTAHGMTKREIDSAKSLFSEYHKNKSLSLFRPRIECMNSYELLREFL